MTESNGWRVFELHDAMSKATKKQLPRHLRPTLLVIGDHVDKHGGAFPGLKRIASILGIDVRQVRRHKDALVALGWITEQKVRRHGQWPKLVFELPFYVLDGEPPDPVEDEAPDDGWPVDERGWPADDGELAVADALSEVEAELPPSDIQIADGEWPKTGGHIEADHRTSSDDHRTSEAPPSDLQVSDEPLEPEIEPLEPARASAHEASGFIDRSGQGSWNGGNSEPANVHEHEREAVAA